MTRITESSRGEFAIELLEKSGYQYVYAPDIAPATDTPERNRFEDVLLSESLQSAVGRITQKRAKSRDTKDDHAIPGYEFKIPNKNMVKIFTTTVTPILEKIFKNTFQIRTLEKLRDTLLPKLMSGEVRVKSEQQEAGT